MGFGAISFKRGHISPILVLHFNKPKSLPKWSKEHFGPTSISAILRYAHFTTIKWDEMGTPLCGPNEGPYGPKL